MKKNPQTEIQRKSGAKVRARKRKSLLYTWLISIASLVFLCASAWAAFYVYDDYRSRTTLDDLSQEMSIVRREKREVPQELEPANDSPWTVTPGAENSTADKLATRENNLSRAEDQPQSVGLLGKETEAPATIVPQEQVNQLSAQTPAPPAASPSPTAPPDELSLYYLSLKERNEDFGGWIHIEHTIVDYPVMYTPDNLEKYLHRNFEGRYSFAGLPFLDIHHSPSSKGVNQIIYAHNMKSGQMFAILNEYLKDDFWQTYRRLSFHTLDSRRDYEVLALIPLVLGKMEDPRMLIFHPLTTENEQAVAEINAYLKAYARRLDGEVEQGDDLLTLVTCRRASDSDRLILVARRHSD